MAEHGAGPFAIHPVCETFSDYRGTEQAEGLLRSMRKDGFDKSFPIRLLQLRTGEFVVIDGRHRLWAAEQLGLTSKPDWYQVVDLDPDDEWGLIEYLANRNFTAREASSSERLLYVLEHMEPHLDERAQKAGWVRDTKGKCRRGHIRKPNRVCADCVRLGPQRQRAIALDEVFPEIPKKRHSGRLLWSEVIGHYAGISSSYVEKARIAWRSGNRQWLVDAAQQQLSITMAARQHLGVELSTRVRRPKPPDEQVLAVAFLNYVRSTGSEDLVDAYLSLLWGAVQGRISFEAFGKDIRAWLRENKPA